MLFAIGVAVASVAIRAPWRERRYSSFMCRSEARFEPVIDASRMFESVFRFLKSCASSHSLLGWSGASGCVVKTQAINCDAHVSEARRDEMPSNEQGFVSLDSRAGRLSLKRPGQHAKRARAGRPGNEC